KLDKVKNLKVELKRSFIKIKKRSRQSVEHILVSYTKPNGQPFSFEAHIDSNTGSTIQVWNQTHHEFKKSVKIKASNFIYKNEDT
ncbi:MAG: hypothetical protein HON90_06205, partial [Halobacteriovoraceae bacterium]|nr:hypothetical protein [Halobacteriovoraceae bacterium]